MRINSTNRLRWSMRTQMAFDTMVPRPAQAARLGNDILLQIFYHLETDASLCVAALVCRSWMPPAQVLLYNTICIGPWDPNDSASFARGDLFTRTMQTAPRLAGLVHYLSLHTGADVIRDQVEWLHLLPEHGLNRFRYMWSSENTFDPYILVAPAIRTVTHFIAHGPQNPYTLRACLSLPNLETLEVSLADCDDDDAGWRDWTRDLHGAASLAPRLRKLIIRMYFVACPAALTLFTLFAPQLAAFQLHAMYEIFEPHREWAAALTSDGGRLKELVLSGSVWWTREGAPFMDDVVRYTRSLELVRCPLGSYSDAFFRDLPPTVRVLELYVDAPHSRFPHERALVEMFREMGAGRRWSALREVCFLSQYRTTAPLSAEVVQAARGAGVGLACERAGLYTPVGCMSEADIVESSEWEVLFHPLCCAEGLMDGLGLQVLVLISVRKVWVDALYWLYDVDRDLCICTTLFITSSEVRALCFCSSFGPQGVGRDAAPLAVGRPCGLHMLTSSSTFDLEAQCLHPPCSLSTIAHPMQRFWASVPRLLAHESYLTWAAVGPDDECRTSNGHPGFRLCLVLARKRLAAK